MALIGIFVKCQHKWSWHEVWIQGEDQKTFQNGQNRDLQPAAGRCGGYCHAAYPAYQPAVSDFDRTFVDTGILHI
jgi:hypothetical protein